MATFFRGRALVLPCVLALAACNTSKPSNVARRADPDSLTAKPSKPQRPPVWERESVPMPPSFAGFPVPQLDALVGAWLVASEIPGQRELWILEEAGRKLTLVDSHGRERVHGLSLQSPCTLAITDEFGRTRSRRFAWVGGRFYSHPEGAAALASGDGSAIACVGTQTIVIPVEGPCVGFTEMLGVWSELGAPAGACARELAELVIGERRLHPIDGVWMDAVLEQALAEKVADRAAGEAALAKAKP